VLLLDFCPWPSSSDATTEVVTFENGELARLKKNEWIDIAENINPRAQSMYVALNCHMISWVSSFHHKWKGQKSENPEYKFVLQALKNLSGSCFFTATDICLTSRSITGEIGTSSKVQCNHSSENVTHA
jgi:hypothetical protein